jgi:predicted nucleotidyltransferase
MKKLETEADVKTKVIDTLQAELPYLRQHYGVTRLAIFGSVARGEDRSDSDIDLLVDLSCPLGLDFVDLVFHLEDVLKRPVDLATFDAFNRTAQNPRRKKLVARVLEDLIDVKPAA